MLKPKTYTVKCDCHSPEHHLFLSYYNSDQELIIETKLNQYNSFWKRFSIAFKYLFQRDIKKSEYDTVILYDEHIDDLVEFLVDCK